MYIIHLCMKCMYIIHLCMNAYMYLLYHSKYNVYKKKSQYPNIYFIKVEILVLLETCLHSCYTYIPRVVVRATKEAGFTTLE